MTTFWKYFFVVFFILAVPVAVYFGFRSYKTLKNPSSPGLNAIVTNTPLIIEIPQPKAFIEKLTQNTDLWKELTNINSLFHFHESVSKLDSIFSGNNQINEILKHNKLYISIHLSPDQKIEPLFIFELPSIGYKYTIQNFIKDVNGEKSIVLNKKYKNVVLSKLNIPGLSRFFNFAVHKGVFIGAFEENLIKEAIGHMNEGVPLTLNEQFKRLNVSAGKNVDANIYLNYTAFTEIALNLTSNENHDLIKNLSSIGLWSETDLMVKPRELLFTGYSITSGDGSRLLDLFRQEPQAIIIPEILPSDVSVMIHLAFEDFTRYTASRRSFERQNNIVRPADSATLIINNPVGINIPAYFNTWVGHEAAWATCGETGDTTANKYIVIHALDIRVASDSLNKLSDQLNHVYVKKKFEEDFEDYIIRRLDTPGIFSDLFGPLFNGFNCPYYFMIRDYVVFANSPGALKYLIANFYAQKTLAANPNFRATSNGISNRSNIFFYCNTRKSLNAVSEFVNEGLSAILTENPATAAAFEGIAVQYSFSGDMFYTSIYLRYNPTFEENDLSGWETELAGNVTGNPYLVRNEETGKLNVVVTDDLSNMYLIDHFGKISWKTPLIESPFSQIYRVDYYGNNKKQLLFNTLNYLYMIDFSGNYVGDYPRKLMTPATNGLTLLESDSKQDYKLLVALSDNRIYKLDIQADKTVDWEKVSASQKVSRPVEHLIIEGKDYFFITDDEGNVTIVNIRGENKIKIKKEFKKAKNSEFYINETNSKGLFITTDNRGKLIYIDQNGKVDRTDFGNFSADHFFLYEDISNDGSKDFIYIDHKKLNVLSRFKESIVEFDFPGDVLTQPLIFRHSNGIILIGVLSSGKLYFVNNEGQVFKENNFSGNTPFTVGSLNSDGKMNLLIGNGKKLYNYQIE